MAGKVGGLLTRGSNALSSAFHTKVGLGSYSTVIRAPYRATVGSLTICIFDGTSTTIL
jgi:hypothetical protein